MERVRTEQTRKKAFLICLAGTASLWDDKTGQVFEGVEQCLKNLGVVSDLALLTDLNARAAYSEWNMHGLPPCTVICTRRRVLVHVLADLLDLEYDRKKVLVVGFGADVLEATQKYGILFYPILPSHEANAWKTLNEEASLKLLHGTYEGRYQQQLLARHNTWLAAEYEQQENKI